MKKRLSRKAKIRREKHRRRQHKTRNLDVVGMINRGGAGAHHGTNPKDAKAPKKSEWE